MTITIARKEFTELLRDGRFRWAAAIVLALLGVAVLAGARYQRDLVTQQRSAQTAEQARWYNQPVKNPHSAAHYGLYAFKPRLAPGFVDPGVEPYTGVAVWIEAHKQNEMLFRPAEDATLAQRFGDLTVALVFQVMLPLVIVLLAFSAFAGERERGTLRQLLALGLRPRDLVLGKMLGLGGALALIVVPAVAVGAVALTQTGSTEGANRFVPLAAIYLLYLGVFLLGSLAVSARAATSRFALVTLLGFWALNCLVAPRALAAFAAKLHPLPEPVAFKARMKEELGDPEGAPAQLQQTIAVLMKQHGVNRPEDLPVSVRGLQLQIGEEHGYEIFDRYYGELFDQMDAQIRVLQRGAALFPLLGVQSLSMALAGTDFALHRDFVRAAEHHRRAEIKVINDDLLHHPTKGSEVHLAGRELWEKVPAFHYAPPGITKVLGQNAAPLALLAAWFGAAAFLAWRNAMPRPPADEKETLGAVRIRVRARRAVREAQNFFMFSTIFRWELRALRRDTSFWIAVALALIAIGFALYNGIDWRSHLQELRASGQSIDAKIAAKSRALAMELDVKPNPRIVPTYDPRNPYGFAHFQMQHSIALPPTALAALTTGQSDLLPQTLWLTPGAPPAMLGTSEPENPYRLLIGPFDAAFVVVALAPLLVIALMHALLAGERERGTLPLLLAQPLTLRTLIAGRLVPRALLGLGLLALLTVAFLTVAGASEATSLARLALWLAVALAYGTFWFALSLAVVTRRGNSATHALALAAIWLGLVVLVPAGINLAVKTLCPVPSRIELILALRKANDEISAQTSKLLAAYYEDHPEFSPKKGAATEYSEVRFITNEKLDRALAPVLARYEAQLARQQALVEKLQFASPALLAQAALADAAGTGLARHREFLRQAALHHADLRAFFNPRILRKEKFDAWDHVPAFRFVEEPTTVITQRIMPALFGLLVAALAFAAWVWRTLHRYSLSA